MRSGPVLTMVFVAGGIGFGAPGDAIAGLATGLTALDRPHGGVVTVGYWRRYYQQYGYGPGRYAVPPVVVPGPVVVPPAVVETPVVPPPPPPRVRQVAGNTAIGTASIASTRATIALTWGRDRKEGCQRC
jgi:hypothetical protein